MHSKSFFRRWLSISLLLSYCGQLLAQDPALPAIIPSSSNGIDLCRAGLVSNSLYSGTATLSIPLYELALRNHTLRIGLQYSSNGLRNSDQPSSVGMGFQLLAGGCITRIIRDESDGVPENIPYSSFPQPGNLNSDLLWYLNATHDHYWDTEPDEYLYNFNGMSGRFFVDSSGIGRCIPENNLKIEVNDIFGSKTITITTVDGTVYFFGKAETTNSFQVYGAHTYSTSYNNETAWFLTHITTQAGEWIQLEYDTLDITVQPGPYTVSYAPTSPNNCGGVGCPSGFESGNNVINHKTHYPVGITSSNGLQITFLYEPRPDYSSSNDLRLYKMTVSENLTGTLNTIKKYSFKYGLSMGYGNIPKNIYRYFLDTLINESIDGSGLEEKFVFEYYKRDHLRDRYFDNEWDVFGYQTTVDEFLPGWEYYPVDSAHIDTAATRAYFERNLFMNQANYPNPAVAPIGMLTKATFPTAGFQKFHYEPNIIFDGYAHGVVAGGVRVKSIENYDPLSATSTRKYYKYTSLTDTSASSGISSYVPFYSSTYNYGVVCGQTIQQCPSTLFSSNSLRPYQSSSGTLITYGSVIESNEPDLANGGIQYTFMNEHPYQQVNVYLGDLFTPAPTGTETNLNGAELKTLVFKKKENDWIKLREATNIYTADYRNQKIQNGYITRRRYQWPYGYNPPQPFEFEGYDVISYRYNSFRYNLARTVTATYDEKGMNPSLDSVLYEYEDTVTWLPTRVIRKASDSATIVTYNIYPNQIDSGMDVHHLMRTSKNMPGVLIESKTYREGHLVSAQKTVFKYAVGDYLVIPEQLQTIMVPDTSIYKTRLKFHAYGTGGNPREISRENNIRQSYIYDYSGAVGFENFPIAEIMGASIADVAYTSFESGGKGEWAFSGVPITNPTSITGGKCYDLGSGNITKIIDPAKVYIVTYWLKDHTGTAMVNSNSPALIVNKNGWSLYQATISASYSVAITGTGKIDELRLHPQNAMMRTMTYRPFIGISSECDANNRIIYYDYDGFGRLILVRDDDKRVLKKNCYTYNGQTENCSVYGNVQKTGTFTRSNCGSGYFGSTVTYVVPANTYFASTQAGADALAQTDVNDNGQDYANANGTCTIGWYNEPRSGQFTKNDCGIGYFGATTTYTVPAGTYSSTISQAHANQLAQDDVDANGQNWVNTYYFCDPATTLYYTSIYSLYNIIYFKFTNALTFQEYFFSTSTFTNPHVPTELGQLPEGYYDVEIYNPGNNNLNYYDVGCDFAYGYTYAYAYWLFLGGSCNFIHFNF